MPIARLVILTTLAMIAFAGNSLLCRVALSSTALDAASFTSIRLISGALTLAALVAALGPRRTMRGNWLSALALFGYAAGFSFAYTSLTVATGALLLFGAVQFTMIGYGLIQGERSSRSQSLGIAVAVAGLLGLLWPGLTAPPLTGAILMLAAGIAWGVYSLRGRGSKDAMAETAGNFVRSVPFALLTSMLFFRVTTIDSAGIGLAVASGALASGVGYAIWYTALPSLSATSAATVQLSVPAIAAAGGVILLGEPFSLRLALASLAILGGVAVYVLSINRSRQTPSAVSTTD